VANSRRHVGDKRNLLYQHLLRILGAKRPTFFLAENVKGIMSLAKGLIFRSILRDFESIGYDVQHAVLNAADFGVPQRRERVFFFGALKGFPLALRFPPKGSYAPREVAPILGLRPWVGIGEALERIPDPDSKHSLNNHEYTKYKLRFNGYLGHRRIDGNLPSPTITARGDERGGVVIHHHPSNTRRLTARETAIIQSFPVDYRFWGTKTSVYRQVANAVPPLLARTIATWLLERLGCDTAASSSPEDSLAKAGD
jgi:DNA (cytosine-5)-methyltransferase 1